MATHILSRANGAGGTGTPEVIEADERNFRQEVTERSRSVPVVVDFWAPWCGPCRVLGPILERLAAEAKGAWVLAKVNVDNNPRLAQAFGVQGIPAVKAFRDGRVVEEFTGALPETQVRAWLKRVAPAQADQLAAEAAALEASDPQAAEARYREVLEKQPDNHEALFGLGRLLVASGDAAGGELLRKIPAGTPFFPRAQAWLALAEFIAEAEQSSLFELLERVDANPSDLDARYQLAAHQTANRRYAEAIDLLLDIVAKNREFRQDAARKAALAIFAALGDQDPLVVSGRRRLANLLF